VVPNRSLADIGGIKFSILFSSSYSVIFKAEVEDKAGPLNKSGTLYLNLPKLLTTP
jgi:hypothetical protein